MVTTVGTTITSIIGQVSKIIIIALTKERLGKTIGTVLIPEITITRMWKTLRERTGDISKISL